MNIRDSAARCIDCGNLPYANTISDNMTQRVRVECSCGRLGPWFQDYKWNGDDSVVSGAIDEWNRAIEADLVKASAALPRVPEQGEKL